MDIDAYSARVTGMQLERKGETSPTLFENKKSPNFGKKSPDCVLNGLNFPFKMWSLFFLCFHKMLFEVPSSTNTSMP